MIELDLEKLTTDELRELRKKITVVTTKRARATAINKFGKEYYRARYLKNREEAKAKAIARYYRIKQLKGNQNGTTREQPLT